MRRTSAKKLIKWKEKAVSVSYQGVEMAKLTKVSNAIIFWNFDNIKISTDKNEKTLYSWWVVSGELHSPWSWMGFGEERGE